MRGEEQQRRRAAVQARLLARPGVPSGGARLGLQPLNLGSTRDGLLYVPVGYHADEPLPLVLMLHGAGGTAARAVRHFQALADEARLILLAPESRGPTWDCLLGGYGPDIAFIDEAFAQVFSRYAVDPERIVAEGFSDGASYALSVGITNGDLFTHVMAFSPGFLAPAGQEGAPRLFISHGTRDEILPIDVCSRQIVPLVQGAGYDVRYREFDGPHTVPPEIVSEALAWLPAEDSQPR